MVAVAGSRVLGLRPMAGRGALGQIIVRVSFGAVGTLAVLGLGAMDSACGSGNGGGASSGSDAGWPCPPAPVAPDAAEQHMQSKRGTMGTAATAMVATSHTLSTKMGLDVLSRGGNAVDAYVAAVLTDDLVLPGVTSTAGLTGFLVYVAASKSIYYVQGPLKAPSVMPTGSSAGAEVMIPGEVAALALASQRFGQLGLANVVGPVATLAQGFAIDKAYADTIQTYAPILSASAYGKKTFFANGAPLAEGATLAQPDVAATLSGIASQGMAYFYAGPWANAFADAVSAAGGTASLADLASYQGLLVDPIIVQHGKATLFTSSGYSNGGARLLLALQALENANVTALGRYDQSPAALELLLRVQAAESTQGWLSDPTALSNPDTAYTDIVSGAQTMWSMASAPESLDVSPDGGSHSSAVVVVDAAGNVVVGTHTIETTPWGLGIFAGGLPLSTAATIVPGTAPGAYAIDPLSSEIAFVGGQAALAMTTYGSGLHPGDVQVLSYMLDFGLDPEDAVLEPRVGGYALTYLSNGSVTVDVSAHVLDERVPASVVCPTRAAGFGLEQSEPPPYVPSTGMVDTGFPTVVTIDPTAGPARLKGMTPEWMNGVAAGF
jgi:gamma-glutamyltranspeptidase/glutathione hydrolase